MRSIRGAVFLLVPAGMLFSLPGGITRGQLNTFAPGIVRVEAAGQSVLFSLRRINTEEKEERMVFRLDLQSGRYTRLAAALLPAGRPARGNAVCRNGSLTYPGRVGMRTVRLRGVTSGDAPGGASVDAARGTGILWYPEDGKGRLRVKNYALADGRLRSRFYLPVTAANPSSVRLLDGVLFLDNQVGAGPGSEGSLHNALTGRRIARLRGGAYGMNVYGCSVLPVRPGVWLFVSGGAAEFLWVQVRTGRTLRYLTMANAGVESGTVAVPLPGRRMLVLYGLGRCGDALLLQLDDGRVLRRYRMQ